MKNNLIAIAVLAALAVGGAALLAAPPKTTLALDSFAQCLKEKGITMYGAGWCPHCQNEKKAFGDSFKFVPYVECPDEPKRCLDAGVTGYPTWIFPHGEKLVGEQGLQKLSEESGCTLYSENSAAAASDKTPDVFADLTSGVAPEEETSSVVLPITWGDLGAKLVSVGAVDAGALQALYAQRGAWTREYENLLLGQDNGQLKITRENAPYLLNLFWALGLANKNEILEEEMRNPAYGGAENFASTAGWTLAKGTAMEHYGRHKFFNLTPEQQALVEKLSKGIYRPCCDNATHFPDCNHGMAMLGLLELMASQGVGEAEMWRAALAVNSYWFPDAYLTIAAFLKNREIEWADANPQEVLGKNYSSASGYRRIAAQVIRPQPQGGGGCGV